MDASAERRGDVVEQPFLMPVTDVFGREQGRAVLVTGAVERGRIRAGDEVEFVGLGGDAGAVVAEIEVGGRRVDEAGADTRVGLLLRGAATGTAEAGQVLAAPDSIDAWTGFTADVTLLSEEQGGAEVRTGRRLQFHLRSAVVPGVVTLPPGTDVLHPLHTGTLTAVLERPVALEPGHFFAYRRHGRAAGTGTVTRLLR
ncbi:EF-Tu/IF-2/RF-3 family GTPase [Streptomyces sp. NPDC059788]|uniref:EF-Tu/IF-2/RF-3 family GTPase n=1 Tax=Streptomyces sp. NPDC059788 TaxID=3346948 RepID=UPI00365E66E1